MICVTRSVQARVDGAILEAPHGDERRAAAFVGAAIDLFHQARDVIDVAYGLAALPMTGRCREGR